MSINSLFDKLRSSEIASALLGNYTRCVHECCGAAPFSPGFRSLKVKVGGVRFLSVTRVGRD